MKQAHLVASLALLALLGCNSAPVRITNFENQPINRLYNQSISLDEIRVDVRMATLKAGWNVAAGDTPGHLTAVRFDGDKSATVEVLYDTHKYSIQYTDSTGLEYQNGCTEKTPGGPIKVQGKCISPTYNEWVMELGSALALKLQY